MRVPSSTEIAVPRQMYANSKGELTSQLKSKTTTGLGWSSELPMLVSRRLWMNPILSVLSGKVRGGRCKMK